MTSAGSCYRDALRIAADPMKRFLVRASYMEIYQEGAYASAAGQRVELVAPKVTRRQRGHDRALVAHACPFADIRDLLSTDPEGKLELKEHPDTGVYVKDLTGASSRQLRHGRRSRCHAACADCPTQSACSPRGALLSQACA